MLSHFNQFLIIHFYDPKIFFLIKQIFKINVKCPKRFNKKLKKEGEMGLFMQKVATTEKVSQTKSCNKYPLL